jgi:hypothetical protein
MIIVEDKEFQQEIIKRIAEREFKERTGVHCSDLIYCLNKQVLRRLNPKPSTDHQILTYSLGWSSQRWLTGKNEDAPEIKKDGIIVTCDSFICPCCGEISNGK